MRFRQGTKVMVVSAVCAFVLAPCSTVLGSARPAAASDQVTADVIVGNVEERSSLDGATAVMAFGLLCGCAAFAGSRRVWVDELQPAEAT